MEEVKQLDLFSFENLHPPKTVQETKPFFLVTIGYCFDRIKYGVKEEKELFVTKYETVEEVRKILTQIVGQAKTEETIQKAMENMDEWQQYNDISEYYF